MSEEGSFPAKSNRGIKNITRNFIVNELSEPLILERFLYEEANIRKWGCINWDIKKWVNVLGNESYRIQFGKKIRESDVLDSPQWEHQNFKSYMNFNELLKWEKGEANCTTLCNKKVSHLDYWAYMDYYYIKNLPNMNLIDENISWECLGFSEIKAKDSTLWIGTTGANTPCHIDTYGVNIVCQIYGKKRWTLFPKEQSSNLYPTRVPYEESSIYSEVGFPKPNIKNFSKLNNTTPFVVTLEAGDVLLVPKHWWHFVENLEFAISINTWIPLFSDTFDRVKEALVLYQIGSLCQSISCPSILRNIFNDNMMEKASMGSSELLESLQYNISKNLIESKSKEVPEERQFKKKLKRDVSSLSVHSTNHVFKYVKKYTFKDYCSLINTKYIGEIELQKSVSNTGSQDNFFKLLLNSFTDDRVITMLKTVLEENMQLLPESNGSKN